MKQLITFLAFILLLFLVGSCAEDPPQAPMTIDPTTLSKYGPPGGGGGGRPGEESAGNNLSFPALAADEFDISSVTSSFAVVYSGEYPGLTADQIAYLEANGPWYPQKTEGNTWSAAFADYVANSAVNYIDWGDNIESASPMLRRPFRLEVRLFSYVSPPMDAYTMAELEYPSSANELQGTNTLVYPSDWATVVSNEPKLVLQYLGATVPLGLAWDNAGHEWKAGDAEFPIIPISFAPELNVGGKYIFGGSEGGWKPDQVGYYRITFYIPELTEINIRPAKVANFVDFVPPTTPAAIAAAESDEGPVATPVVDPDNNLTYVDVLVISGGGGGGKKPN